MNTRRDFLKQLSLHTGGLLLLGNAFSVFAEELGSGAIAQKRPVGNVPQKLGVALVGLGKYSEEQLAPALMETGFCRLAGIVTGTPSKAEKWKKEYNIPDANIYNYQNFDSIKNNKDIDIVYVVLPNALHAEYVIRAAQAGKHVICEKPMAVTPEECERMIKACKDANRMLSIGYRLHFEPYNMEMARLGREKVFGKLHDIKADDGMDLPGGTWRTNKALAGGGPLMDVGIYCVQAAIYTFGQNPISVTALEGTKTDPERFKEVEQSMAFNLEFPGGLMAECKTSYAQEMNLLRAEAEKGWFELSPAYSYKGQKGKTSEGKMDFPHINQQAAQMDDFAQCIMNGTKTRVPGEMGLRDVKILKAIYEAARTGNKVTLSL